MYHIQKVSIDGFWGRYKVETDFYGDVNIFIGQNGTGKTTFILFIQAVLDVDIPILYSLKFDTIKLTLKDKNKLKNIVVTRNFNENGFETATYRISNKPFKIPLYGNDIDERRSSTRTRRIDYEKLKDELSKLINISTLSVYRLSAPEKYDDEESYYRRKITGYSLPIENRLMKLMNLLTSYQLQLADEITNISKEFQKDVSKSILYDKKFDSFTGTEFQDEEKYELDSQRKALTNAFRTLGVYDPNIAKSIESHITVIGKSLEEIKKSKESNRYTINSILPLPLLKRTKYIIQLLLKAENKRKQINEPIEIFLSSLRKFIIDKSISTNQLSGLEFKKDDILIPINTLSSGEKQLLILLTETLLQQSKPFIFIADEPELSLHIDWQSKILKTIQELNPNTQIIVATHSPEIASSFDNSIIDMGNLIHE